MKLPSQLVLDCAYMHERTEQICHLTKSHLPLFQKHTVSRNIPRT